MGLVSWLIAFGLDIDDWFLFGAFWLVMALVVAFIGVF